MNVIHLTLKMCFYKTLKIKMSKEKRPQLSQTIINQTYLP